MTLSNDGTLGGSFRTYAYTIGPNGPEIYNYNLNYWKTICDNNQICGGYAQEADKSDRGSWRVPNQKELVMMRREGILSSGTNNQDAWLSCTQEHYDSNINKTTNADKVEVPNTRRFFMFFPNRGTINTQAARFRVRCVRDKSDEMN